jgi:hypothetical protein
MVMTEGTGIPVPQRDIHLFAEKETHSRLLKNRATTRMSQRFMPFMYKLRRLEAKSRASRLSRRTGRVALRRVKNEVYAE